jgi:hypothetical protein
MSLQHADQALRTPAVASTAVQGILDVDAHVDAGEMGR